MISSYFAETADQAWLKAAHAFKEDKASLQTSRAGETVEILHATLSLSDPRQRWVVSRHPAINVAFALAETIWILRGREDSAFLTYWNRKLPRYAGEGPTFYGAYGYRLRHSLGIDQLERAYLALKNNTDSRQVVLQIWNGSTDIPNEDGTPRSPDIPCNIVALLKVRNGLLEWTQVMRSNDLVLGVPHNFVQFTTLQEVIAGWLGIDVGSYNHYSDSLHVYDNKLEDVKGSKALRAEVNNEDLRLPKAESDKIFYELENRLEQFMKESLSEAEHERISKWDAPQAYQNMLSIFAAEAARRRRWISMSDEIAGRCTNPLLNQLWVRWLDRVRPDSTK